MQLAIIPRMTKRTYGALYVAGALFWFPTLQWMRLGDEAMYLAWFALAAYLAIYFPLFAGLTRTAVRRFRAPLWIAAPVVWVGLEFVRAHLMTGFAWYFLGHSQHAYLAVIQIADVTGVYGITFLIAAVNAWLFDGLYRLAWFRGVFQLDEAKAHGVGRTRTAQIILILAAVVLTCGYGLWRLKAVDLRYSNRRRSPSVAGCSSRLRGIRRRRECCGLHSTSRDCVSAYTFGPCPG